MSCYHPVSIVNRKFEPGVSDPGSYILRVPCGHCIGCRLDYSRMWAIRCVHEASCWDDNHYITLTFDEEHIYKCKNFSLNKKEFQTFLKRLRYHFTGYKIRYFHGGEYGEERGRPHHHCCFFNLPLKDLVEAPSRSEDQLYRSEFFESIWENGVCWIGRVTFKSAAYIARYLLKTLTYSETAARYRGRELPYVTMSRNPGLGALFLEKYAPEIYNNDMVMVDGVKSKPPRFYDNKYSLVNPYRLEELKHERMKKMNPTEQTPSRLLVREKYQEEKVKFFTRSKGE